MPEGAEMAQLEAMMQLSAGFHQMSSTGAEYRQILENDGFSPAIAEQIAAHFLMEQLSLMTRSHKMGEVPA